MTFDRNDINKLLYKAYLDARKNERNSRSALEFEINLEYNLRELREEIYKRKYTLSPSFCFIVQNPSKREVFAPSFRDRVVSHLVYNILCPMVDPLFIYDSYSCRVGKGTRFGIERFKHQLASSTHNFTKKSYVLCLDISGYFMNINKYILRKLVLDMIESRRGKINTDYNLLEYLVTEIINNNTVKGCIKLGDPREWNGLPPYKSLYNMPCYKGLPIGALTSQLFSNIYLNALDQFIKRKLKCKYYGRYVDDARIIHTDKEYLQSIIPIIKNFLKEELDLDLNENKTKIISSYKRQEFLGAVIQCQRTYATTRTLRTFAYRVRSLDLDQDIKVTQSQLNSYLGYLSYFRSNKVLDNTINQMNLLNLFEFAKTKVKIKNYDENFNVGLGTPNVRAL